METYTIRVSHGDDNDSEFTGTLAELIGEVFYYDLLKGKSWEHEKGNKKINLTPATIQSLVTNLNNAARNARATGNPTVKYSLV